VAELAPQGALLGRWRPAPFSSAALHPGVGVILPTLVSPPVNDHVHAGPPLGSQSFVQIPVIPLHDDKGG
jgi:hypothetical protein